MLKIEIDARARKNEFKATGIAPELYAEAGIAMMMIYRSFRERYPEEEAQDMMHRLLKRSMMTNEEIEVERKRQEIEEPEIRRATEAVLKYIRNGKKEEDKREIEKAMEEVVRKKNGNAG